MKHLKKIIVFLFLLVLHIPTANAQLWKKLKEKAEKAILDKTDKEVDDLFNKKKNKTQKKEKKLESKNDPLENKEIINTKKTNTPLTLYRNFKFIPGEKIIFYDDLSFEEVGEFPSKWDLLKGGAEIAKLGDEKVIIPTTDNTYGNIIIPFLNTSDYLGTEFTIEFDIYIDALKDAYDKQSFALFFESDKTKFVNQRGSYGGYDNGDIEFTIDKKGLEGKIYQDLTSGYDNFPLENISKSEIELNQWQHISISYHRKKLKVYFNNQRVGNLPNYPLTINGFAIKLLPPVDYSVNNEHIGKKSLKTGIKNIRIAHGGGQMYKRILQNGKYVTNGILFDSGKATIQPKSMGIINKMVAILKEKTDWNFDIIGHTDSDGDNTVNLNLSKKRAEAVKNIIVTQGIKANRLSTFGKGESQPLNSNRNALEKANNRRVVFIKNN